VILVIAVLIQRVWFVVAAADVSVIVLVGSTFTVAVVAVPVQVRLALVKVGVIVKVTGTDEVVVFVGVPLMFPVPLAAMPVTEIVLFLIQLNTVPGTLPVFVIVVIAFPEHSVCDAGTAVTSGTGFTTNGTASVEPEVQPFASNGVTLIVVVTGAFVVLVSIALPILPVPLAGKPATVRLLVLVQV
jgi:hypothetical protein